MDYTNLERRVTILEGAVIGTFGKPGIAELQRAQAKDISNLSAALDSISANVKDMADARRKENDIREGEQKMLRTLRNLAIVLLLGTGIGGGVLGSRILSVLNALTP